MLENLRRLRTETSVTQKQLAEAIGISQQSINKYENHNIEPDIDTLIRIADFFGTSVDYLIGKSTVKQFAPELSVHNLTPEEMHLIDKFRKLSQKQKNCIQLIVDSYNA